MCLFERSLYRDTVISIDSINLIYINYNIKTLKKLCRNFEVQIN